MSQPDNNDRGDAMTVDNAYFEERARAQQERIEDSMTLKLGLALPPHRRRLYPDTLCADGDYEPHRW